LQSVKKQALSAAGDELKKQLSGKNDTTHAGGTGDAKKGIEESAKGLLNNFLKKKKPADSTKQ